MRPARLTSPKTRAQISGSPSSAPGRTHRDDRIDRFGAYARVDGSCRRDVRDRSHPNASALAFRSRRVTSAALLFVTRRVLLLAAWCCVGCLALAALLRIAAFDRTRFGTLIDATTLWVFIPAWVILVVAVIARRHGLAVTAGVIVALHLLWVAPPLLHRRAIPAVARHAPRLRVVTANLRFDNADQVPLARELADSGADVLVLQEVTARWWASL